MRGGDTLVDEHGWMSGICSNFYHSTEKSETFSYRCPSSVTRIGSEEPIHATASPRGKPRGRNHGFLPHNAPLCPVRFRAADSRPYRAFPDFTPLKLFFADSYTVYIFFSAGRRRRRCRRPVSGGRWRGCPHPPRSSGTAPRRPCCWASRGSPPHGSGG